MGRETLKLAENAAVALDSDWDSLAGGVGVVAGTLVLFCGGGKWGLGAMPVGFRRGFLCKDAFV